MAQSLPTLRDNFGFLTLFRRYKEQDKTHKHTDLYLWTCIMHSNTIHNRDSNKSRESLGMGAWLPYFILPDNYKIFHLSIDRHLKSENNKDVIKWVKREQGEKITGLRFLFWFYFLPINNYGDFLSELTFVPTLYHMEAVILSHWHLPFAAVCPKRGRQGCRSLDNKAQKAAGAGVRKGLLGFPRWDPTPWLNWGWRGGVGVCMRMCVLQNKVSWV